MRAHLDPVIVELTLDGEQLEATPVHPFFVVGAGLDACCGAASW